MVNERGGIEEPSGREPGNAGGDDAEGTPPIDEALEALSHPTRRSALYALREREVATVDEVARAVVSERTEASSDDAPADRRDRVKSGLVHAHLPKLDRSAYVEYDRRGETVSYADPPEPLEGIVELLAETER